MQRESPTADGQATPARHVPELEADSFEHFRNAVQWAPIGIICVSGAKGRYVFANEAFARLIGRSLDEVLASDPFQIANEATHPEDRMLGKEAMGRIAKGEMDRYRYEKRLVSKSGEIVWASVEMVATRDTEGRLAFLTQYFTDIADRRAADETQARLAAELRHAQKLEALGRLAGGVAHDFNNRLVIILGYTELLKRRLGTDDPLHLHADMVLESAQRATELTQQLLAYSRKQVQKLVVFDLSEAVENMRRLLERLIGDEVQLVTRLTARHQVSSDRGQIEQVIINLALNARDAMPHGGRLLLETKDVVVHANNDEKLPPGDYISLVVSDTGMGIAEGVIGSIFDPFFTTKAPGLGTGLGLATVEGIVRQAGGAITVESSVGEGATFTVFLPRGLEVSVESAHPSPPQSVPATDFETVLVCDDDDAVRKLMVEVLRLRGYTILEAAEGREALAIVEGGSRPIDLLVTDVIMPGFGGAQLAAELRKRYPRIHVLYVSGYTDDRRMLSGSYEPRTAFLPKPFRPGDLTEAVCSLIEARPTKS
jgi:PAS domain S-box-containing protein